MNDTPTCGICGGLIELRHAGAADVVSADAMAPSNHRVAEHSAIFICRECGTLQQPALVNRTDLTGLYREMRDHTYLAEETGRRRTSARLLSLIGAYVSSGRLLDVGCGHGLLLDEARKRGYEPVGLELSATSARHAQEVLGLDVRQHTLEDLDDTHRFEVITLVDVIEHLADPVAAIRRCRDLLAPHGMLCIVTPSPDSLTARIAGRRWWALLPAHTYLIPRRTLLELIAGCGLIPVGDSPFIRSFSVKYWLAGLAERGGPVGQLAALVERVVRPGAATLSASLGDERVVLASRVPTQAPKRRLVSDRGGAPKVHVILPAYNAGQTIPIVARTIPIGAADRALLVDDHSTDQTVEIALQEGFEVIRHPVNLGYGANQKTCYVRSALDGADIVVMVHADHQYDPALIPDMVAPIVDGRAAVVIGSRLLEDEAIAGGMPRWKWVGNRFLTAVENAVFRRSYSEYHTGYRAFSIDFLRTIPFLRNSNSFVFDQELFAQAVARNARVVEVAIPTRYFLEASSVSFATSVKYGLSTLGVLARFIAHARRPGWTLLRRPAVRLAVEEVGGAGGEARTVFGIDDSRGGSVAEP